MFACKSVCLWGKVYTGVGVRVSLLYTFWWVWHLFACSLVLFPEQLFRPRLHYLWEHTRFISKLTPSHWLDAAAHRTSSSGMSPSAAFCTPSRTAQSINKSQKCQKLQHLATCFKNLCASMFCVCVWLNLIVLLSPKDFGCVHVFCL